MKPFLILCAASMLAASAPATDSETVNDVRCFLAMSSIVGSEDKTAGMAAMIGAQYFLGRIDGRSPTLDLEAAFTAETSRLTEPVVKSLLVSCGELMKSRGQAVQMIGKRMEAKGL